MDSTPEQILARISEWQQMGYEAWNRHKRQRACECWQQGWTLVTGLMQSGRFASIEELDKLYHGRQSLAIWAADYGEALYLAGLDDLQALPASVAFNEQMLAWSARKDDINSNNRRRMIGESIFRMAGPAAGDTVYRGYLAEYPRWGWGWVSWSDQYGFDTRAAWHDLARAESILREALQIEGIDNRPVILERLRDILLRQGRAAAAAAVGSARQPIWRRWPKK